MKKTLFIISAFVLCHTSFGQTNSILPSQELGQRLNERYAENDFFIPLKNLEKNNSYDAPMSIDEYNVVAGVPTLTYTHEFTYTPAGVLVSITKYDNGMNAQDRTIYARDIDGNVTSIIIMTDVAGSLEFDQRVTIEYAQGILIQQLEEEYNLGTNEWEFAQLSTYEYVGGYSYPSEITITSTYASSIVYLDKIKYLYDSNNNPTFVGMYYYDEDFQAWIPSQVWDIADWGPKAFKADFIYTNYMIPTGKISDYIIGKMNNYDVYPADFTYNSGYDILTETFGNIQSLNSSVYDANDNRTQFFIDEVTPSGNIPDVRIDSEYDPCYGYKKSLGYSYNAGVYELDSGSEFVGETTPYLSSCYVTAYNRFSSFSMANPSGTWDKRYEINHVSNLSVDESEISLFEVYPNPATENITIQSLTDGKSNVKITDLIGKVILEKEVNDKVNTFNLNQFPQGIYIIEYNSNGSVQTSRFVKQ